MAHYFVGTAGWTVPKDFASSFSDQGSHLERYADRLNGVEINSSFYREHQGKTYRRWAESVPADFRFSVKLSKVFTHQRKLQVDADSLKEVLAPVFELGDKLAVLLVQLPPSLAFDRETALGFFENLRRVYSGAVALEPRHVSWNERDCFDLLNENAISRVVADPDPIQRTREATGFHELLAYFRLHGSPVIYRSTYEAPVLAQWRARLQAAAQTCKNVWCIFDNTTFGFATQNALTQRDLLEDSVDQARLLELSR